MSKRAEEAAIKAYPEGGGIIRISDSAWFEYDERAPGRKAFQEGYECAQQDIIATIQSRIDEILGDAQPAPILRMELQELIKKIEL